MNPHIHTTHAVIIRSSTEGFSKDVIILRELTHLPTVGEDEMGVDRRTETLLERVWRAVWGILQADGFRLPLEIARKTSQNDEF